MLYLFIFTLAASQALRKNHQPSCEQEEQEGDGEERRAGEGETRRGEHEEEQTAGHQVSTKRRNVRIWMFLKDLQSHNLPLSVLRLSLFFMLLLKTHYCWVCFNYSDL